MEETMTDHDQLCPCYGNPLPDFCDCRIITLARADERKKIAAAIEERLKDMHSDLSNPRYEEAVRIARSGGRDE